MAAVMRALNQGWSAGGWLVHQVLDLTPKKEVKGCDFWGTRRATKKFFIVITSTSDPPVRKSGVELQSGVHYENGGRHHLVERSCWACPVPAEAGAIVLAYPVSDLLGLFSLQKKNGPYTLYTLKAQNTFTLGESRICSTKVGGEWVTAWSVEISMFGFVIDVIKDLAFVRVGAGRSVCKDSDIVDCI